MLDLPRVRTLRRLHNLGPDHLSSLTSIEKPRLRQIELCTHEPYLDEAYALHRILGTDNILVLTGRDSLYECLSVPPMPVDFARAAWLEDRRLPLSIAFTLALDFGLTDPAQLVTSPLHAQIWDILSATERLPAGGLCPWCQASVTTGEPHARACLPANLWPGRARSPVFGPRPIWLRPETKADRRGRSQPAKGLRAIRERAGKSQIEVAKALGYTSQGAISALERLERPLTIQFAKKFAMYFNVDEVELYADPVENDASQATL